MDPITAFQVAASVVTFVDFARVLVSTACNIYRSPDGQSATVVALSTVGSDLNRVRKQIESTIARFPAVESEPDREMLKLCEQCADIDATLQLAINGLTARGTSKIDYAKKSFVVAARGLWNEDRLVFLNQELDTIRSRIMFSMMVSIWRDSRSNAQSDEKLHDKLDQVAENMDTKMESFAHDLRQLRSVLREEKQLATLNGDSTLEENPGMPVATRTRNDFVDAIWQSDWEPNPQDTATATHTPSRSSGHINEAMIESLSFPSMDDRGVTIPKAYESTLQWIFHRADDTTRDGAATPLAKEMTGFAEWLESEDSLVYWITGKPGSGKSTLVKYITGHPSLPAFLGTWAKRRETTPLWAGFYFWDAGSNPLQKSREGMMQTLLYHCLRQRPDLLPVIAPRRWALYNAIGSAVFKAPPWTWKELKQTCFRLAARSGTDFRLALFIDGLDEFGGQPEDIISLVKDIQATYDVKICVASRPWMEFADALDRSPSLTMQAFTHDDIPRYIRGHFGACRAFNERRVAYPIESDTLMKDLASRANGVFLWVTVVVRLLILDLNQGQDLQRLQQTLESLPRDISELYTKIWESIGPARLETSSRFFRIKMASYGNIRLDARLMYLALGETLPDGTSEEQVQERIKPILTRKLDSFSKGLLEISHRGSVEFIHRTATDWAKHPTTRKAMASSAIAAPEFDPALVLLKAANTLLTPDIRLTDEVQRWTLFQLLTIAGRVADRPEFVPELTEVLDSLDKTLSESHFDSATDDDHRHWSCKILCASPTTVGSSFVCLAAYFAIIPYVRAKIQQYPKLLSHPGNRPSLLECALQPSLPPHFFNRGVYAAQDGMPPEYDWHFWLRPHRERHIQMIDLILVSGGSAEARVRLARDGSSTVRKWATMRAKQSMLYRIDDNLSLEYGNKLYWDKVWPLLEAHKSSGTARLRMDCVQKMVRWRNKLRP